MQIKNARESNKMTQAQLAHIIGVSQSTIAQWEGGITLPSVKNLMLLSKALHCTLDELLADRR